MTIETIIAILLAISSVEGAVIGWLLWQIWKQLPDEPDSGGTGAA